MRVISTKYRSDLPEIMDEFDFNGKELEQVLQSIDRINTALGGHRVTIQGIENLIRTTANKKYIIVDVGCGSGASLRKLAKWANQRKEKFQFIGIDANPDCIAIAKKTSKKFTNISFECINVFSNEFEQINADVIFSSLTLHHFKNKDLISLLQKLKQQAQLGVVINDLHRSKLAYYLFLMYGFLFIKSKVAKHDGLISILRGFKSEDFNNYAQQIPLSKHQIKWCWAFRYQWIIHNK